jgi:protein ImuB
VTDASSSKRRRHLALWFPHLSADRLRQQEPDRRASTSAPPDAPVVFVAKQKNALRLAAVDALALTLGLAPGMTLADARVREPGLIAVEFDAAADRHWLERLAQTCIRFSPHVVPHPPQAISIDISGVEHLFGGEAGLAEAIADHIEARGMTVRMAGAATAEGALALARYAPLPVADEAAAIRALPVAALGLDDEATLGLVRAGLKAVGAVAARPRSALAARFGIEAVRALEQLLGDAHQPGTPLPHQAPLRFERRFAEPIAHERAVAAAFAELLNEAAQALRERGLGGRRFRLMLDRSDGARRRLDIETGAPTRDLALVLRLFDERIAALADPLDPGFGYDQLVLAIMFAEPLAATQPALDGTDKDDGTLAELIDRLSTRLGPSSIRRLIPQDSYIPEQAQLALPVIHAGAPVPWPTPAKGEPPLRPLFLFDPPQPVEVIAEVPDGPPHRFRWKEKLHEVRLYEGPERIAGEWWRRKGGEQSGRGGLTRDYYRIEDARGRRYWLFRHGLYDEKPQPRWYLHGLFA